MKKAFTLYSLGFVAVGLALWQQAFAWLSPLMFILVFPVCAIWLWRSEGHALQDLGLRPVEHWRRYLSWGLLMGVLLPVVVFLVQVLCGWMELMPRILAFHDLATYISLTIVKMLFIVSIEEFVFRGYFLQRFSLGLGIAWPVLLSSVLWSMGHLLSMVREGLSLFSITIGMFTFIAWGTALSLGCIRTAKSLWLPFGLHYGVNLSFSLLGIFFLTSYHAPQWLVGHPAWAPESGVFGTLVWVLAIGIVLMITRPGSYDQKLDA